MDDMRDKIFTSLCFRTQNLSNFVKYYQRILLYGGHRFVFMDLFDKTNSINKIAIVKGSEKLKIYFPAFFEYSVLNKQTDFYEVNSVKV